MLPSLVGTCTCTCTYIRGIHWYGSSSRCSRARTCTPCARLLYNGRRNEAGCYPGLIGRGEPLRWNIRSMKREDGGSKEQKPRKKKNSPGVIFHKCWQIWNILLVELIVFE